MLTTVLLTVNSDFNVPNYRSVQDLVSKCLKSSSFLSIFVFLTTLMHKNGHYLAVLHLTIFFKLHRVAHMILHQIVYLNFKNNGLKSRKSGCFLGSLAILLYRTVSPDFYMAV